jgi:four helix bundle protein
MSDIITFRDLDTWQHAMDLAEQIYRMTARFPREELYGLTGQMRRAAVSIPSNVAEGYCRRSIAAYANHVAIALGSHGELETCVELASRLQFLADTDRIALFGLCESTGRLLSGLHRSLDAKIDRNRSRP